MNELIKKYNWTAAAFMFIILPLIILALGDVPRRTALKDSISLLTLTAFFMMLSQFFSTRSIKAVKVHQMSRVIKLHKIIGYVFMPVLLIHPVLIVVPRYFEAGVTPAEAFMTLLTTPNQGSLLGMTAWCIMLILGITSLLRKRLGLKHKTWRLIHGLLSILFIVTAAWHAIDLGRHTDLALSVYIIIIAAGAVLLLLKTYFPQPQKTVEQ